MQPTLFRKVVPHYAILPEVTIPLHKQLAIVRLGLSVGID